MNVDFRLTKGKQIILCDVKEVRDSENRLKPGAARLGGKIDAQAHIRGDIKKLRQKFDSPPADPLILVSMNYSSIFFTALTVSRALMGEIGVTYEQGSGEIASDIQHLHAGNAATTQKKNRSISGVLIFDVAGENHYLFRSPYATYAAPVDFFNGVRVIDLQKDETPDEIIKLSKITFWNRNTS
jgi:hypothetical protein